MGWGVAASGALALAICLIAAPLGRILGVVDVPDGLRHRHARPTPMTGGLAVIVPAILAAATLAATTELGPFYATMTAAMAAFLVLGLIDDRRHMRPLLRLSLSAAIILGVLLAVPATTVTFLRFSFYDLALLLPGWWGIGFTVLCLVGLQNALNMADGKNGLAIGLVLIWLVILATYAPAHLLPLLGVMIAALAVTGVFNLRERLFLGDSGTYSLSVAAGLLTIYVYNVNFVALHADVAALWFLIPVVDALRLILYRIMSGRSPLSSDRLHFHHMLLKLMPWQWGWTVYMILVAGPALAARAAPDLAPWWAAIGLAFYGAVVAANHWDAQTRRLRLPRQG